MQDPDRNGEAIISEQRTKLVGQRRSLLNNQLMCVPKRLDILLFCGFYRNKVNTRAKCCLANCQRIIGIIFLATDKSFYVLCGDESDAIAIDAKVRSQKCEVAQASIATIVPGSNCRIVSSNLEREIFLFHETEPSTIQTQT